MRILLALAFLLAFSTSAYAQGNTITVVGDDGTVTSIDIGPSPLEPQGAPENKSVRISPPVVVEPAPVVEPAKEPAKKPAAPKQATKKEVKKSPAKKEVKKAAAPKKKKASQKPKQKAKKKQAAPAAAPEKTPPRPTAAPLQHGLGAQMTPDDAIRIALDAAPPARSVNAYPVNYKGLHAYQVVFDTEDGKRSVFIDRETGKLVK